jgi:hypothetical protein
VTLSTPQTSHSDLIPAARKVVAPSGIVSSGFPKTRAICSAIGIEFDPWQVGLNTLILAKDSTGLLAADTVAMSIPRQVGKTFDVGALIFADCIAHPGTTVVWTAHRFKVARETFGELRGWAESPKLAPHIDRDAITSAAGNEVIPFRNGSRIVFAARERGSIRGFTKVRRLILDEAQILSEVAMSDLLPTMNQAHDPQVILMGTPPKPTDQSETFVGLRTTALDGSSEGLLWVEFGVPPESDLDDVFVWRCANPSFPKRTPQRAIQRLRNNLSDDDFAREALGIWDTSQGKGVIPGPAWRAAADEESAAIDRVTLGIEVAPDLTAASVALAGMRRDEAWHIELDQTFAGVDALVPYVESLVEANPGIRGVIVDVAGPVKALLEQKAGGWRFKGSRLRVTPIKVAELGAGCAMVLNGVVTGDVHHIDQPQLSAAALSAGKRPLGDTGMWVWSRKMATSDITPIQAATLALSGAQAAKPLVKRPTSAHRAERELTIL